MTTIARIQQESETARMKQTLEQLVECVDVSGKAIGTAPKLDVHFDGQLHRAISVFAFNAKGEQLLQQRALHKYHAPGLWSNTVCSHPIPGESPWDAAHRRLKEELNMTAELCEVFVMRYRADVGGGLVEHEYDHVFVARVLSEPAPNPAEVHAVKWMNKSDVTAALNHSPDTFTPWFRMAHAEVLRSLHTREPRRAKVILTPSGDKATFLFPEMETAIPVPA
jgi:isopentenyl-diphosphate delta-isomerase